MSQALIAAAIGSQVLGGIVGSKGNQAAARTVEQIGEFNAQLADNEATLLQRQKREEEAALRRQSDRLISTQRVATAKSGVQMSGSPLQALADAYFNTEKDAARIQYASSIQQMQKESEGTLSRLEGQATAQSLRIQAQQSLLGGFTDAASTGASLV
tara:strand:+ start:139 stop:609 length:471 start_codon:yes stop_codon:yes gene_type:complete